LQTRWIYGRQGAKGLKDLHPFKQYELGMETGLNLKLIHHCAIPKKLPPVWEKLQLKRYLHALDAYQFCRSKIAYEQKIISMIEDNLHLLANRPQKLLHGGFHTENMILSYEDSLSLIDFDRWQYGDPMFDLANVLTRIRRVSQPYATGILDCYFAFNIKDQDLRLMNLYAAIDLIEQVVAARSEPADTTRQVLEHIQLFMRELHGCRNISPNWYKRSKPSTKKDIDL
jgi:aminoglycoside phosphotransferase (APT) family kinase protein